MFLPFEEAAIVSNSQFYNMINKYGKWHAILMCKINSLGDMPSLLSYESYFEMSSIRWHILS